MTEQFQVAFINHPRSTQEHVRTCLVCFVSVVCSNNKLESDIWMQGQNYVAYAGNNSLRIFQALVSRMV